LTTQINLELCQYLGPISVMDYFGEVYISMFMFYFLDTSWDLRCYWL